MRGTVGSCEADALAHSKVAKLFPKDCALSGHALLQGRVIGNLVGIACHDRKCVGVDINRKDGGRALVCDAVLGGAACVVTNLVRRRIVSGEDADCRSAARPAPESSSCPAPSVPGIAAPRG